MKNSNNGFVVFVILALIALVGIGGTVAYTHSKLKVAGNVKIETGTATTSPKVESNNTASSSVSELLSMNKPLKCSFESKAIKTMAISGTAYINGGKMRVDSSNFHAIIDSQNVYIWTSTSTQGFKFPVTVKGTLDLDQKNNHKCVSWNPDVSLFQLPTRVMFDNKINIGGSQGAYMDITGPVDVNFKK